MDASEKWVSVELVARILSLSEDTIRRLVSRGHLEAIQLPQEGHRRKRVYRTTRIARSSVDRFIERFKVRR